MPLTLHFQSTGTVPGDGRPVSMVGKSLTVGRGTENDMVLPDPDKMISKRHCSLEQSGEEIVVIDLSSNGTYLNYGKVPLGPTPTPLSDGDILTLGSFEIRVEILRSDQAHSGAPGQPGSANEGLLETRNVLDDLTSGDIPGGGIDFLDDLLGSADKPTGPGSVKRPQPGDDGLLPPLDLEDVELFANRHASPGADITGASQQDHSPAINDSFAPIPAATIPDDWDLDAPADDPFAEPVPAMEPFPAASPIPAFEEHAVTPETALPEQPATVSTPAEQDPMAQQTPVAVIERAPVDAGDKVAVQAFMKAAGAEDLLPLGPDTVPTFSRLGHVFRILVTGLREILMTRSSIKSEFRIEHTKISAGGNNPLKFSVSPEQAIEAMIKASSRGYLDSAEAASEALQDIKAHEVAMIAGMEAALKGVLARLSPEALESRLQPSSGLGGLLSNKKARYWEIYQDMYTEISDEAEKDFHDLFSKEFARAYEAQLERLK